VDHDVNALIEELDAARAERRRLEGDLLAVRASLDEQLQQAGVLGRAVAEADETASELVRAEAEIGALRDRAERSAAALSRAEAELEGLRQELARLRAEHDGAVATAEQSAEESAASELAWARLQAELERSRANVAAWRDRLSTAEDEAERLAGELAEATARLERVQAVAARGDARVSEVQALLVAADDELHHTRAELDRARSDLDLSRSELHAVRLELEQSHADLQRLQQVRGEEQAQRAEIDALRRSAAADRDEIELLHRDLQQARAESDRQLQTLHLELSDARLRADEAHEALAELAAEFTSFRDSVLRQQSTVSNLAARLDRARGVLGGRTPEALKGPALFAPAVTDVPDDLGVLPGASDDFVGGLHELGVTSYEEIGSWDAQQLERYEDALGDVHGVMRANGWVMAARRLWEERTGSSWSDRGQRS
jgi:chromosome segregation ATPase